MPFKKQPSTLNTLCLKIVTTNIDLFNDTMLELPNTLIDQLLAELPDFIHPRTQTLEIDCRMPGIQDLVTKVIDTCKMLKELTLRDGSMYRPVRNSLRYSWTKRDSSSPICDFTELIRNVPKLEDLNLMGTCTDDLLLEIGQHCPNLLNLNIDQGNKKFVTNRGILALCIDETTGQSRNLALRRISMVSVWQQVTVEAFHVALRNLPHLTTFIHSFWDDLLPILESEKAIRTYPSIKYCKDLYPHELPTAVSVFPNMCECDITVSDYDGDGKSFTFVITVISDIMESLTELRLSSFEDLDISTVAIQCPKLQKLSLSFCRTKSDHQMLKKPFEELKNLHLCSPRITEKILFDVLVNSPGLTSLELYHCPWFDDSFVTDLCVFNALSHMQKLCISCYKRDLMLSLDGFKQILTMKNPLKSFILRISELDGLICNDLEEFITFNNLDIDFEY